jgi:hypothetical protein
MQVQSRSDSVFTGNKATIQVYLVYLTLDHCLCDYEQVEKSGGAEKVWKIYVGDVKDLLEV